MQHAGRHFGHAGLARSIHQLFMNILQFGFGALAFRDVTKTPDAARAFAGDALGLGITLEHPPVLEFHRVITFRLWQGVQLLHLSQERFFVL